MYRPMHRNRSKTRNRVYSSEAIPCVHNHVMSQVRECAHNAYYPEQQLLLVVCALILLHTMRTTLSNSCFLWCVHSYFYTHAYYPEQQLLLVVCALILLHTMRTTLSNSCFLWCVHSYFYTHAYYPEQQLLLVVCALILLHTMRTTLSNSCFLWCVHSYFYTHAYYPEQQLLLVVCALILLHTCILPWATAASCGVCTHTSTHMHTTLSNSCFLWCVHSYFYTHAYYPEQQLLLVVCALILLHTCILPWATAASCGVCTHTSTHMHTTLSNSCFLWCVHSYFYTHAYYPEQQLLLVVCALILLHTCILPWATAASCGVCTHTSTHMHTTLSNSCFLWCVHSYFYTHAYYPEQQLLLVVCALILLHTCILPWATAASCALILLHTRILPWATAASCALILLHTRILPWATAASCCVCTMHTTLSNNCFLWCMHSYFYTHAYYPEQQLLLVHSYFYTHAYYPEQQLLLVVCALCILPWATTASCGVCTHTSTHMHTTLSNSCFLCTHTSTHMHTTLSNSCFLWWVNSYFRWQSLSSKMW